MPVWANVNKEKGGRGFGFRGIWELLGVGWVGVGGFYVVFVLLAVTVRSYLWTL